MIFVVYDKELERTLRARKQLFEQESQRGLHEWFEVDVTSVFARWMTQDEYREAYFESPADLSLKLEGEFASVVAETIRSELTRSDVTQTSVVGVFGVGSLFGFTRLSKVLKLVEADIKGRMVVFFPGTFDQNNYRLLDARDGWNYLAVPITLLGSGEYS
ncbi:MAG: BREX protein BrxB domain-containing protein [Gemmatimonadales bacterium]